MLARLPLFVFLGLAGLPLFAQTPCEGTPAYSPCELTFELSAGDLGAHPNPHASVEIKAEFRSPRFNT